jgi:hypothetical protein
MMTREQVYGFFANFGIVTGAKNSPISHKRFVTIVRAARQWHGMAFAKFTFDCFVPLGDVYSGGVPEQWILDMPHPREVENNEEGS